MADLVTKKGSELATANTAVNDSVIALKGGLLKRFLVGAANGLAALDGSAKLPSAYLERGAIIAGTNFNSIIENGFYGYYNTANTNSPSGVYGYGLLAVLRAGNQVVQVYFPHHATDRPVWRVAFDYTQSNWTAWRTF